MLITCICGCHQVITIHNHLKFGQHVHFSYCHFFVDKRDETRRNPTPYGFRERNFWTFPASLRKKFKSLAHPIRSLWIWACWVSRPKLSQLPLFSLALLGSGGLHVTCSSSPPFDPHQANRWHLPLSHSGARGCLMLLPGEILTQISFIDGI